MPDFTRRSAETELMDTEVVSFAEFHECLRQLEIINILTFGYRLTLRWLMPQLRAGDFILDLGSGGGDMLRRIAARAKKPVTLTGIDINPRSKQSALQSPSAAPVTYETADIFAYAPPQKPDFIISALFTHHLGDEALVRLLRWMEENAARGWFINDLHRHPIPYYFIKTVTRLLPVNRLIRHDSYISVARAFTASDWRRLLAQAGIPASQVTIRWFFTFRHGVGRIK